MQGQCNLRNYICKWAFVPKQFQWALSKTLCAQRFVCLTLPPFEEGVRPVPRLISVLIVLVHALCTWSFHFHP